MKYNFFPITNDLSASVKGNPFALTLTIENGENTFSMVKTKINNKNGILYKITYLNFRKDLKIICLFLPLTVGDLKLICLYKIVADFFGNLDVSIFCKCSVNLLGIIGIFT